MIEIPRQAQVDADVHIVEALNRIALRIDQEDDSAADPGKGKAMRKGLSLQRSGGQTDRNVTPPQNWGFSSYVLGWRWIKMKSCFSTQRKKCGW